jgi:outer membrane protein assembly factor BamA
MCCKWCLRLATFVLFTVFFSLSARTQDNATDTLKEVRIDGAKILSNASVVTMTGLTPGSQIGRPDLQAAADRLVQSGFFAKVSYNFQSRLEGVFVTFHVEEAPIFPVHFDNLPWFGDSELNDAIRKNLPFYDGKLPEAGNMVDQATNAVKDLLKQHGLNVSVEHQLLANPLGDGNLQVFRIEGASLQIAKIEFSDASLVESKVIRQHLDEILGKPYSRMTIDLFLSEQVRPVYLQKGYLRAKLGPPEIRLTGNPNQKLPEQIPVFVPVSTGPLYHWKNVQWTGNSLLSTITLNTLIGLKPNDLADGMALEAAWDHVREEYGRRGCLDVKLDPHPTYDDTAHTVSYAVNIQEGPQYKFGNMVLTGISPAGERRLHDVWLIPSGAVFDKTQFEELLTKLEVHPQQIFGDLPIHYESVGHWLQTDQDKGTVDILLDFK